MKLVYKNMGHIIRFDEGYVPELVIENKKMFCEMVNSMSLQIEYAHGDCVLSVSDKPVEFSRHADIIIKFAPFELNRKNLLTKLYATLEEKALLSENYMNTSELLSKLENYVHNIAEDLPFDITCKKVSIATVLRAICPEINESDKSVMEKIFTYMEIVNELDRERLFIMVNMRAYFSDSEMETFIESVCLHDFKVLLLESTSFSKLKNTKRYTIDDDFCEF